MLHNHYSNKQSAETKLIEEVVAFLNQNGFSAWRQANTGRFNQAACISGITKIILNVLKVAVAGHAKLIKGDDLVDQVKRVVANSWMKQPGGVKGVSDVLGYSRKTGQFIAIEVKIGNDRLSEEQMNFLKSIKSSGGQAYVARDFVEFAKTFYRTNSRAVHS